MAADRNSLIEGAAGPGLALFWWSGVGWGNNFPAQIVLQLCTHFPDGSLGWRNIFPSSRMLLEFLDNGSCFQVCGEVTWRLAGCRYQLWEEESWRSLQSLTHYWPGTQSVWRKTMAGIFEWVHVYTGFALGAKLEALKKTGNKTGRAGPPLQVGQYAVQSRTLKLRQVHIKASGYRLNVFDIIKVPGQPPGLLFTTCHWSRSSLQLSL